MNRAFTRIELLVVLAVLALLVCVKLPALGRVATMSKIAQCAANLKQDALALQLYGADNGNNLPFVGSGNWPWDLSRVVLNLLPQYGTLRAQLYDPAYPSQNADVMWNYSANYGATGYAWCLGYGGSGSPRVFADDLNTTLSAQMLAVNGSDPQLTATIPAGTM